MNKPHIHAEAIKSWADGKKIESRAPYRWDWQDAEFPSWAEDYLYRVKPELEPDFVAYVKVTAYKELAVNFDSCSTTPRPADNLRLTFDGETQKLKRADIIQPDLRGKFIGFVPHTFPPFPR
jgi:hypothetical protein